MPPKRTKDEQQEKPPRRAPTLGEIKRRIPMIDESVDEMSSAEISPLLDSLKEKGESFEKIISFYLAKKNFSETQTKKWLDKYNEFREERSLSSLPADVESSTSSETKNLKFSEEAISKFYNRLSTEADWDVEPAVERKLSLAQTEHETSSDSDCEMNVREKSPLRRMLRRSPKPKRASWKEYKKTKNIDSFLYQKTENPGVKKLVKMTIKELWKQKKAQSIENEEYKVIEVDKEEVADMIYEVTDHMARKYLPKIRSLARKLDPATDRPASECESGSYDSQDEFYPAREDKRSLLPKLAMSVNPDVLVNHGLREILLITLPLCASYTDDDQLLEFVEILKETPECQTIPAKGTTRDIQQTEAVSKHEEKPIRPKTVVVCATVEASPSLDTLAGVLEIEESKETSRGDDDESDSTSSKSATADIRERLRRGTLKSVASEDSQSVPWIDDVTSDSMDTDVYKAEAAPEPESGQDSSLAAPEQTENAGQTKRERSPMPLESPSKRIIKDNM